MISRNVSWQITIVSRVTEDVMSDMIQCFVLIIHLVFKGQACDMYVCIFFLLLTKKPLKKGHCYLYHGVVH